MKNNKISFKKEKGTTLVEVLLSVALLAIIVTPLMGAVMSSIKTNSAAKDKTEAIALAERVMGEIKAWDSMGATTPIGTQVPYTATPIGNLAPYYEITRDDTGSVTKSGTTEAMPSGDITYTYDTQAANNADFVLEIDQGSVSDGKVSVSAGIIPGTLNKVASDSLELKVTKAVVDGNSTYSYYIGDKTTGSVISSETFSPKDRINAITRLKVIYKGTPPSSTEQLKIYTNIISDVADSFKVYVIDNEDTNYGVSFINTGAKDFEVIYMDSQAFDYSGEINGLFKITVTIEKNGHPIYSTSSYVKK